MPRFRPRLTFSLRTLFVVVTACALYLGSQAQMVRERQAVVRWTKSELSCPCHLRDGDKVLISRDDFDVPLPWIRRQLGDCPYHWSCMYPEDPDDVARILAAFPNVEAHQFVAATRKLVPIGAPSKDARAP